MDSTWGVIFRTNLNMGNSTWWQQFSIILSWFSQCFSQETFDLGDVGVKLLPIHVHFLPSIQLQHLRWQRRHAETTVNAFRLPNAFQRMNLLTCLSWFRWSRWRTTSPGRAVRRGIHSTKAATNAQETENEQGPPTLLVWQRQINFFPDNFSQCLLQMYNLVLSIGMVRPTRKETLLTSNDVANENTGNPAIWLPTCRKPRLFHKVFASMLLRNIETIGNPTTPNTVSVQTDVWKST